MTDPERSAIAAVCVMAALADGTQSPEEREQVHTILDGIGLPALGAVPERVARGEATPASAAAALGSRDLREHAWEMAVCVTNADGVTSDAERRCLDGLRGTLSLPAAAADTVRMRGEALAAAAATPVTGGTDGDVTDDPQYRHLDRRARAAAAGSREPRHHPAPGAARVSHRAAPQSTARPDGGARPDRDRRNRAHGADVRVGRPSDRRGDRSCRRGQPHRRPDHDRDRGGAHVRHHLRAGAGRPELLRRGPHPGRRAAQGALPAEAGRGEGPLRALRRRGPDRGRRPWTLGKLIDLVRGA